jgi:hypothetical protein
VYVYVYGFHRKALGIHWKLEEIAAGIVFRYCVPVLYHGIVSRYCVPVLCPGIMSITHILLVNSGIYAFKRNFLRIERESSLLREDSAGQETAEITKMSMSGSCDVVRMPTLQHRNWRVAN